MRDKLMSNLTETNKKERNAQPEKVVLIGEVEKSAWKIFRRKNNNVHDSVGNIYTVESNWIFNALGFRQETLKNFTLNKTDTYKSRKEINDPVLRKQLKKSIGYGKGQVIEEKRI